MTRFIDWCRTGQVVGVMLLLSIALAQEQQMPEDLLQLQQQDAAWALPGKDFAATRFSSIEQINVENVQGLSLAWSFSTGLLRGHEGQPLVVGDTMYLVTPFPNHVYALDLTQPREKPVKWFYEPKNDSAAPGLACCDVVNRGVAYGNGKIIMNTLDGHVHAIDAETGELVWRVKNSELHRAETMTHAPLVAKDKVIVGVSGGEFGVRGYVTAYDLETGERLWRFYNTGPDDEVGIGERFEAPYEWLAGEDLGVETWPEEQWRLGGSTTWGWLSYDPELNLVYYGTGNPGVWNADLRRKGEDRMDVDQVKWANLWSLAVMARDLDTGELAWAYQFTPHSMADHDSTQENILVDLEIDGQMRKTLVHFDKNGFAYTLDRTTGEVLVAEEFVHVNWAERIDLETGLPVRNPEKNTAQGVNVENICPSALGGKDAPQAAAYSPRTNLFYVPTTNVCMDFESTSTDYIGGLPYVGATVKMYPGPGGNRGAFIAWDAVKGERVWEVQEEFAVWGGALVTAGNVVFYGTMDGWFRAVHADTGEVLWQFKTGSGIVGSPISYLGPDGKQYIAILSGIGGWPGLVVASEISTHDRNSALGAVNAFADLGQFTRKGGALYVFALEDSPPEARGNPTPKTAPGTVVSTLIAQLALMVQASQEPEGWYTESQAAEGGDIFTEECAKCHGNNLAGVARNPGLKGDRFLKDFENVWELFDFVRTEMPLPHPGKLDDEEYLDVVAFLLRENGFPVGEQPLEADQQRLQQLEITQELAQLAQVSDPEEPADMDEPEKVNPFTLDPSAIEEGRKMFTDFKCAGCHGPQGGGAIGPSLSDQFWIYGARDSTVFDVIRNGRAGMPPFENFEDEEIWKLIAFIRSLYRGPAEGVEW